MLKTVHIKGGRKKKANSGRKLNYIKAVIKKDLLGKRSLG